MSDKLTIWLSDKSKGMRGKESWNIPLRGMEFGKRNDTKKNQKKTNFVNPKIRSRYHSDSNSNAPLSWGTEMTVIL